MVNNVRNHVNNGFHLCKNVNVVCELSRGLAIKHGKQFDFPTHFKLINETLKSVNKTKYSGSTFSFTSRVITFTVY